jgi:hypothetical protein
LNRLVRSGSTINRSPSLQHMVESLAEHVQSYNKLITDHECILGEVVRKPNMVPHTVAYMRAGPRAHLHYDPAMVHAAIVTCGGLCPGLNNVIREITKTLHQIYGISGKVYGIQGTTYVCGAGDNGECVAHCCCSLL